MEKEPIEELRGIRKKLDKLIKTNPRKFKEEIKRIEKFLIATCIDLMTAGASENFYSIYSIVLWHKKRKIQRKINYFAFCLLCSDSRN